MSNRQIASDRSALDTFQKRRYIQRKTKRDTFHCLTISQEGYEFKK